MHEVYLGLGSNLGHRARQLQQAIRLLGQLVGPVVRQSSFIETEPWGYQSEHSFLNAAVCCQTDLTPREVLSRTQQIERELGKQKTHASTRWEGQAVQYKDRPIDIDILLYDDQHIDEPGLKIPHPLMQEREFVMRPLSEILTNQNK